VRRAKRVTSVLGLRVYADESGIHDKHGLAPGSEVTAIAGYIATARNWEIASRRWNTDGRVITEVLNSKTLPKSLKSNSALLAQLGHAYK